MVDQYDWQPLSSKLIWDYSSLWMVYLVIKSVLGLEKISVKPSTQEVELSILFWLIPCLSYSW